MITKPIGKLRNGELFRYHDQEQLYRVTGSGYGRPHVQFEKYPDGKDTYNDVHKKEHTVEVVEKSSLHN